MAKFSDFRCLICSSMIKFAGRKVFFVSSNSFAGGRNTINRSRIDLQENTFLNPENISGKVFGAIVGAKKIYVEISQFLIVISEGVRKKFL